MRIPAKALALSGLGLLLALHSCVERESGKEVKKAPAESRSAAPSSKQPEKTLAGKQGVWHTVEPGQTFWRICKTYGVDPGEVARVNRIPDAAQIRVGQKIFIPGARQALKVEPYPGFKGAPAPAPGSPTKPAATYPIPRKPSSAPLLWPVPNGKLYSPYGMRNGAMHDGIDISAPAGSAILAADDGKVTYSGNTIRGYGNMIVLKHAGNLATVYAHNRKNLVHEGEMVRRGQKIAEVGETGRATGSHCHFEVRLGKQAVNPLFYLKEAK